MEKRVIVDNLINTIITQLPNFLGLLIAVYFMDRVNRRLLTTLDKCLHVINDKYPINGHYEPSNSPAPPHP